MSVCGTGTSHLARGFSWQCGIRNFATTFRSPSQLSLMGNGFAYFPSLTAWTRISNTALTYPPASPHCSNGEEVVQEYQPVVHRLRLSASAQVPTNPERTSLPQETLGIRWRDSHPSFATHTGILTSKRSTSPSGLASQPLERSPTTVRRTVRSFGDTFSPGTFSAQSHSTSELLRTL